MLKDFSQYPDFAPFFFPEILRSFDFLPGYTRRSHAGAKAKAAIFVAPAGGLGGWSYKEADENESCLFLWFWRFLKDLFFGLEGVRESKTKAWKRSENNKSLHNYHDDLSKTMGEKILPQKNVSFHGGISGFSISLQKRKIHDFPGISMRFSTPFSSSKTQRLRFAEVQLQLLLALRAQQESPKSKSERQQVGFTGFGASVCVFFLGLVGFERVNGGGSTFLLVFIDFFRLYFLGFLEAWERVF